MNKADTEVLSQLARMLDGLANGPSAEPVRADAEDVSPDVRAVAERANELLGRYQELTLFLVQLSGGDLKGDAPRGRMAALHAGKALQSALRHLTWKTKQVAAGDLTQTVDFMSDFSEAFNSMTRQLDAAFKEITQKNEELAEANRVKTEFMDMAIHDFANPLNVISGFAGLLRDGLYGELTDEQCEVLASILAAEKTLEGLRGDMLELSRFERGKMELNLEPVDMHALVEKCVEELSSLAGSKHQTVKVGDVPREPVSCDERKMGQVVTNYLSNAIRYTAEGGHIEVRGERSAGLLQVSVTDNGRGIAAEDIGSVFDSFFRSGERVEGSTGLGLAVVKTLVEAHGGEVRCESELGKGSTFYFSIPADK